MYGGWLFRCWYSDSGFGSDEVQSIIGGVTHYRLALENETDGQASPKELLQLQSLN